MRQSPIRHIVFIVKENRSFDQVYEMHQLEHCDMRTAAYLVAVKRVADATAKFGVSWAIVYSQVRGRRAVV